MSQNTCVLCNEHESLPSQEACAICANDAGYASEQFSDGATETEPDWDEEHRRAAESGELYDDHEYSYY